MNIGVFGPAMPGGPATDLMILAATLSALAGLLFLLYVVAVVAGVAYGTIRGGTRRGAER